MREHLCVLRKVLTQHRKGIYGFHSDELYGSSDRTEIKAADRHPLIGGLCAPSAASMEEYEVDRRLRLAASSYLHTIQDFSPPPLNISADRSVEDAGIVYTPRHNDDYSSAEAREAMERGETLISPVPMPFEAAMFDSDDESESESGLTSGDDGDSSDFGEDGPGSDSSDDEEGDGTRSDELASTASCSTSSEFSDERDEAEQVGDAHGLDALAC